MTGILGSAHERETLSVFNQRHNRKNAPPTITIGVTKTANQRWQKTVYGKTDDLLQPFPDFEIAYARSSPLTA